MHLYFPCERSSIARVRDTSDGGHGKDGDGHGDANGISVGEADATFLPGVAQENGWRGEQTLDELVKKAGCDTDPPLQSIRDLE